MKARISRRRFLGGVFIAAPGASSCARWSESERLQPTFVTVPSPGRSRPTVKRLPLRDRWIHVTRGAGSVFGVRINCPPEPGFLTLT